MGEPPTTTRRGGARIAARGWGHRYPGRESAALTDVTVEVGAGELVVLMGASGSGKSTLLSALAGTLPAGGSQGGLDVTVAGGRAARVGLVQQLPEGNVVMELVGDDVAFPLENAATPVDRIWPRVAEVLAEVGLAVPLDRDTTRLSGGQSQLLGVAAASVADPDLLLLDEPTANLDPSAAADVLRAVDRVRAIHGCTVVVVEHRVEPWLERADRVLLAADGTVTSLTPGELTQHLAARPDAAARVWLDHRRLPDRRPTRGPGAVVLVAHGVGVVDRLAPTDLTVRAGEVVALVGPPGSGKTTLLLCLAGLLTPSRGHVEVGGRDGTMRADPWAWPSREIAATFGVVFQNPEHQFLTGRVVDELRHGLRGGHRTGLGRSGLGRTGPHSVGQHSVGPHSVRPDSAGPDSVGPDVGPDSAGPDRVGPEGSGEPGSTEKGPGGSAGDEAESRVAGMLDRLHLTALADVDPFTLSGGEQRRLSVGTALVLDPRILLLDEPTFGQDPTTWSEVVDIVAAHRDAGGAVVVATHDPALVRALGARDVRLGEDRLDADRLDSDRLDLDHSEPALAELGSPTRPDRPRHGPPAHALPESHLTEGNHPQSNLPESDLPESDSAESDLPESDRSDSDVSQSGDATRLGRPKLGRRTRLGRLDPLALLGAAILVSGAALVSTSVPLNLGLAALALGAALVGGLPSGRIGLLGTPALLATLSVAVSNALLSPTGLMSRDAWQAAALPASRVLAVALPGLVAAVAVDPTALADALVARLRVPARAAYSTLAALRLLPLLADEWATLGRASRARGTGGSGLRARSAQFLSMTFRLLVAALRRGGRLAIALDARGLRPGAPRTLARPLRWRWSDSAALGFGGLAAIVAVTLRW